MDRVEVLLEPVGARTRNPDPDVRAVGIEAETLYRFGGFLTGNVDLASRPPPGSCERMDPERDMFFRTDDNPMRAAEALARLSRVVAEAAGAGDTPWSLECGHFGPPGIACRKRVAAAAVDRIEDIARCEGRSANACWRILTSEEEITIEGPEGSLDRPGPITRVRLDGRIVVTASSAE